MPDSCWVGWRTRLLWGTLILLVWAVPRLCHLPASLASFCSLAQRTKHWNVSSPQPVQRPDIFILRFSLSLCNGPGCTFLLVMSVFPSPSCCLHLLNYCVSKCLRALYTLRSVQQLCSCLSNPSLFKPHYCVLFCTWPVLPPFHRLVNSLSSVVR